MIKRIFAGMICIAVTVMILCGTFLIGILYDCFDNLIYTELQNQAYFITNGIASDGDAYLNRIIQSENRITLIRPDGSVSFDSEYDAESMDNHLDREEVQKAFASGEGKSVRYSDTIGTQTLYYAKKMDNGSVLRVAAEMDSVWVLVLGVVQPMIFVLICTAFIAAILSQVTAKRIVRPINNIDLSNPEFDEPYEELAPLVQKIRTQNSRIQEQIQELRRKRAEFSIITENMSEGILIVDKKTEILSYNSAALRFLDVTEEDAARSRSVLEVNRNESIRIAVEQALKGMNCEQLMTAGEMCYLIAANPVFHGDGISGVIIIILDVTEKEKREQLRREFTSNVSHELKTPLTTIYGIADMLCGGIVKPEDTKGFSETIRNESHRMMLLIDDIIKLSHLDEAGSDTERYPLNLLAMAKNVADRLSYTAEKAGVTVAVKGIDAVIEGIPAVIEENGQACFSVEDTGIGIPKEEQERVFERFYRADKSHSRKIGGTGLGLSIVKHGAALHKAAVTLESSEGRGTKVSVVFHPCV